LPLQGDLLAYIQARGVPFQDADDVLQDSAGVMLAKIGQFKLGTNFRAWAFAIVKNEILRAFKTITRRPLSLDEGVYETIAVIAENEETVPSIRLKSLNFCLEKLKDKARTLIDLRYRKSLNTSQISKRLNRPVISIYTSLSRIRKQLLDCVSRRELSREGANESFS